MKKLTNLLKQQRYLVIAVFLALTITIGGYQLLLQIFPDTANIYLSIAVPVTLIFYAWLLIINTKGR